MKAKEILSEFTSRHPSRIALHDSFSQGEWSYATDAVIAIRVPRLSDVPERKDAPKNMQESIWNTAPNSGEWTPLSHIGIPTAPKTIDVECPECGECFGHTEKELGIPLFNTFMAPAQLRRLEVLPDCELSPNKDPLGAISIRFTGGEGLVMPMREP